MNPLIKKALDRAVWQKFNIRTNLTWAIENGRAFVASDRWEVAAGATDYVELVTDPDTDLRIYNRIVGADGGRWEIDLLRAQSITAGSDSLVTASLNERINATPKTQFRRGASSPASPEIIEKALLPSERGPQSAGALQDINVFRVTNGNPANSLVLALKNTDAFAHTVNLQVIWSEE